MKYITDITNINEGMLEGGFFDGWPNPPSTHTHYRILQNSFRFIAAIDEDTNQVIGFITAISDGVLSAYIPLLEVLPFYKNRGIGSKLVKMMLDELNSLYMIDLLCDAELQPYYEKQGMSKAQGMMKRYYENQHGEL
ncbi:GNAT family N-acetyltransferase [Bacillus salitolerans]|uniref:GNAT family N-acetyltransferase n=1 Tax=Bacillus salitolerans TaxID=1437434 RepID=A0ABW4LTL1_9BACI